MTLARSRRPVDPESGGQGGDTKKAGAKSDKRMTALRNEGRPGRETGARPNFGRDASSIALISAQSLAVQAALRALNNANARETSFLTDEDWRELVAGAFAATCATGAAALLIALDHDAKYRSVDFKWFRARRRRFVYVDRIVVSERDRGRGLATCLYRDLFERAREASLRAHFGPARGCVCSRVNPPTGARARQWLRRVCRSATTSMRRNSRGTGVDDDADRAATTTTQDRAGSLRKKLLQPSAWIAPGAPLAPVDGIGDQGSSQAISPGTYGRHRSERGPGIGRLPTPW